MDDDDVVQHGVERVRNKRVYSLLAAAALVWTTAGPVAAETIHGALAKAYRNNSTLNASRAGVRVIDENVPIAKSGYRPTIGAVGTIDYTAQRGGSRLTTGSIGFQIDQTIFDGFQTLNTVRSAKAQVRAAGEDLRNSEQNTLTDAAAAFMSVIRDRQFAVLRQRNLEFLEEQVRAARSRFDVGEGTRTDVAQAEASRAIAVSDLTQARAAAQSSAAIYRQIIGEEPGSLKGASPVVKLLPKSLEAAYTIGSSEHPGIKYSELLVDSAGFDVKTAEGALLPGVSANIGVSQTYSNTSPDGGSVATGGNGFRDPSANIGATLTIPIYQGGRVSATVRQRKETLGQRRIEVDVSRDQVRASITSAWTQYQAAQQTLAAFRESVSAFQLALNGVIEERNVGQRTTLDVLDAQADVITAQLSAVQAEYDLVVSSYAIVSAIGRLSVQRLGLNVAVYKPEEHYEAVKDKWSGLRTPDGR